MAYDSYTKLLIKFNGADAATTHTAETGQTVTFAGTAQIDTAQKKLGISSLLLDGNSDYVTVPDSDDWTLGAGDWSFDFWVRFNSLTGYQFFWGHYQDDSNAFSIFKTDTHKIHVGGRNGSGTDVGFETNSAVFSSANQWYHVEVSRNGATNYCFVDGVSQAITNLAAFGTYVNVGAVPNIGRYYATYYFMNGWIDNFRFSKGICRHTANFTPPVSEIAYHANQMNIGDVFKPLVGAQINIGDSWKEIIGAQINIGDVWKTIF